MKKLCNKCQAKTLPPLAVCCAGMLGASLTCGACGESWRIKLHPLPRLGAFLWLVLACSMSTYAGILMFSWWPIVIAWAVLVVLLFCSAWYGGLEKRFDLDRR